MSPRALRAGMGLEGAGRSVASQSYSGGGDSGGCGGAGEASVTLQKRVSELEARLAAQEAAHQAELARLHGDLEELRGLADRVEREQLRGQRSAADAFVRRVEWTVSGLSEKRSNMHPGESLWSPLFNAAGMEGLQLEFFPLGREKTTYEGFCSLFLWCPSGVRVKYQLFVGSFMRAPDVDEYPENIGHGHSNFCPVRPEIDQENDRVVVGAVFLEVTTLAPSSGELRVIPRPVEAMVAKEVDVVQNRPVNKVVWKIKQISRRIEQLPRGASMYSPLFTAAGIREMLLELYPNGSTQTSKDGFCAFYVRCTPGVSMVITLFVGKCRKGPIKTLFEGLAGKGLPDFCLLRDQVAEDDSLQVGIELKNEQSGTMVVES